MVVYLNGRFVPEEHAKISVHDRGFLYGDGLFEGVRFYDGEPFVWPDHIARFEHGCSVLGLRCPLTGEEMRCIAREAMRRNGLPNGLARFVLSRGIGMRGYSPRGADHPTFALTCHALGPMPSAYKVLVSTIKLPVADPISDFKNINKLHQILARAEADAAGMNEALLTNTKGFVVEGTTTNLFWVTGETVCTPPVRGILAGTTRGHVLRLCTRLGLKTAERNIRADQLAQVDGIFLTSCAAEIVEVSHLDGRPVKRSPIAKRLKRQFRAFTT